DPYAQAQAPYAQAQAPYAQAQAPYAQAQAPYAQAQAPYAQAQAPYAQAQAPYAQQGEHAQAPTSQNGMSPAFRAYQDSFSDEPPPSLPAPRTSIFRWLVAVLILGVIAFVGGTVGVKYAKRVVGVPAAASAPVTDERVRKLLESGDADLSRA